MSMDDLVRDSGRDSIRPLVVDLDGTLIRSDILVEGVFAHVGSKLTGAIEVAQALRGGKASLKHFLANEQNLNSSELPYDPRVLAVIAEARSEGRKVYLATASHQLQAEAVADHLGLFDGVFATDGDHNLSGMNKARALEQAFGSGNFDYVANDFADLEVWKHARVAYVVGPSRRLAKRVQMLGIPLRTFPRERPSVRTWAKALRVHQYAKNTLLFVPALTSHTFEPLKLLLVLLGVIAFSAAASAVYLLNDLFDIGADRGHPTKRNRPFARGSLRWQEGVIAIALLTAGALALGLLLSLKFAAVLFAYMVVTTSYSLLLKRKMLIDVVVLAMLYTVRVVAGGVLIDAEISKWLLAFSLMIFTSLAIIKRYVELSKRLSDGLPDPRNRNYRKSDLPILSALAAATAANAVTIFALYISSETVAAMYSRPLFLWLICPLLLYFLGRALMLAHRGEMHDDPIVFALSDPVSRATVALCGLFVLLAI
jgi:4-hydroxybenzoate polyprenyltransferase/phosphoserine phosphatase